MMNSVRTGFAGLLVLASVQLAGAQQRPLVTEDPEPIGAGRLLIESGLSYSHDQEFPVSGLQGSLWQIPTVGLSFGISSIAEFQIDGGFYNRMSIDHRGPGPLAGLVRATGDSTSDVEDVVVATKIRLFTERVSRPAVALRFATRLPVAENESGIGLDTTDFHAVLIGAKTIQSIRVVGNVGVGVLSDPARGDRQNDVFLYGLSVARALTDEAEVVGEINGRVSTRSGDAPAGTESRGRLLIGTRYTVGSFRLDGGLFVGLTTVDPTWGFTGGFTYVFNAFDVP